MLATPIERASPFHVNSLASSRGSHAFSARCTLRRAPRLEVGWSLELQNSPLASRDASSPHTDTHRANKGLAMARGRDSRQGLLATGGERLSKCGQSKSFFCSMCQVATELTLQPL